MSFIFNITGSCDQIKYLFDSNIGVRLVIRNIFPFITDNECLTHFEIMEEQTMRCLAVACFLMLAYKNAVMVSSFSFVQTNCYIYPILFDTTHNYTYISF